MAHDGLVPFLIDWGSTVNPATTAPGGVSLVELSGTTADPGAANAVLAALNLPTLAGPIGSAQLGLIVNIAAGGEA